MAVSCGLVGVPGCGKTTLYNAVTASQEATFADGATHRAIVEAPDPRVTRLVEIYRPKKVIRAKFELIDIPGLATGDAADGRAGRWLAGLKEADALLHVVRCFGDPSDIDPLGDVENVGLELLVADSATLENKINRLAKRVRAGDKDAMREREDCMKVAAALQEGTPVRQQDLSRREAESIRDCQLLSEKPVLYVANLEIPADQTRDEVQAIAHLAAEEGALFLTVCGRDEADISQLDPEDRSVFLSELGIEESSLARVAQAAYQTLGLVDFFTAGEKEVHVWTCRLGDTAPVAAGKIHTDMERGFIRMEIIPYEALSELESESAAIEAGRRQLVGKEYVIQDGDIVVVRFSPAK
ncbi:redox-regulated ATPase YchF [Candidatus Bipolaricaulota bacterium]|nr:redox-regulated ATPase YchF [Candidatus Bipolaricaulota bacterium]